MTKREIDQRALLIVKDAEIKRLKALLVRAAEALAIELDLESPEHHASLLDELRKAVSYL
jgi:hypothetical protein